MSKLLGLILMFPVALLVVAVLLRIIGYIDTKWPTFFWGRRP